MYDSARVETRIGKSETLGVYPEPLTRTAATGPAAAARPGSGFFRSSLVIFVVSSSGSVFAMLFQIVTVRHLSPADWGTLGALQALYLYLAIPGQPIQLVFSRHASRYLAEGNPGRVRGMMRQMLRIVFGLSLLYLLVPLVFFAGLRDFYHLDGIAALGLAFLGGVIMLYFSLGLGALQALQRFGLFGACQAGISVSKLVLGGGLAKLGLGLNGVLAGLAMGPLLILIGMGREIRHALAAIPTVPSGRRDRFVILEALPLLLTFGGFNILFNLDITFVQKYFGGDGSNVVGLYNAAATLGKTVLYLPLAIVTVTYAKVADAQARNEAHQHFLWKNLVLTLFLSGAGIIVLATFPEWLLELYTGDPEYREATPLLRLYLLPMALFGVVAVFMNYFFALGHRSFALIMVLGAVATRVFFGASHDTPADIIASLTWVSAALTALSFALLPGYRVLRGRRH